MTSRLACLLLLVLLLTGGCSPYGDHGCVVECAHAQRAMPGVPSRMVSVGFRGSAERHVILLFRLPGGWRVFDPQTGTFRLSTPRGLTGFPPPLVAARLVRPHDEVTDAAWYD